MRKLSCLFVISLALGACGKDGDPNRPGDPGDGPQCSSPTPVACADQALLELALNDDGPAPGLITSSLDGGIFSTTVDATAGGFSSATPHAYVYARFTPDGLEKVALDDSAALDSMDWDIAFRRYRIRVNSGSSGPSCVSVALAQQRGDVAALQAVPSTAVFAQETYYSNSCQLITDGGLGDPAFALGGYFRYSESTNCLQMTGNVYVIRLADGRAVKLTVDGYYAPQAQLDCNADVNGGGDRSGSAQLRLRWAFVTP